MSGKKTLSAIFYMACALTALVGAQERDARRGVVMDERLAVLRGEPFYNGGFVRRLGRGRRVVVLSTRRDAGGAWFCRVAVTRRTRGWLPRESLLLPGKGDEERLLRLIEASTGFERVARAQLFLQHATRATPRQRAAVLALIAETASRAAEDLTREARRRFAREEKGDPTHLYFLNYGGLDRYHRQGVRFIYDRVTNSFHYDGAHLRELVRRYPRSDEAARARRTLAATTAER